MVKKIAIGALFAVGVLIAGIANAAPFNFFVGGTNTSTSPGAGQVVSNNGTSFCYVPTSTDGLFLMQSSTAPCGAQWTIPITGTSSDVLFFNGSNVPTGDNNFTWNSSTVTLSFGGIISSGVTSSIQGGGILNISAGLGSPATLGYALNLNGGTGKSNGLAGGGPVNILGGHATNINGNGGPINISGGTSSGTGIAGDVILGGGHAGASGVRGNVRIFQVANPLILETLDPSGLTASRTLSFADESGTTTLGTGVSGNCAQWSTTSTLTSSGSACGSGGGGSTVLTANQIAFGSPSNTPTSSQYFQAYPTGTTNPFESQHTIPQIFLIGDNSSSSINPFFAITASQLNTSTTSTVNGTGLDLLGGNTNNTSTAGGYVDVVGGCNSDFSQCGEAELTTETGNAAVEVFDSQVTIGSSNNIDINAANNLDLFGGGGGSILIPNGDIQINPSSGANVDIIDAANGDTVQLNQNNITGNRTINFPDAAGTFVLGSGASNFIPLWNGTNSLTTSTLSSDGSGNISESANFSVNGTLSVTSTATFKNSITQSGGTVAFASTTITGSATTTGAAIFQNSITQSGGRAAFASTTINGNATTTGALAVGTTLNVSSSITQSGGSNTIATTSILGAASTTGAFNVGGALSATGAVAFSNLGGAPSIGCVQAAAGTGALSNVGSACLTSPVTVANGGTGQTTKAYMDFLGSISMPSTAVSSSLLTIAARETLMFVIQIQGYGGSDVASLRFNSDSGVNYWQRSTADLLGSALTTNTQRPSQTLMELANASSTTNRIVTVICSNHKTTNKVCTMSEMTDTGSAATVGAIDNGGGEWFNTAAQITTVTLTTAGGQTLLASSSIAVYGNNP